MNDDFSQLMTPFDQYISNQSLQMTKLLIPFMPPQVQRMMAVYVKFQEFRYTMSSFRAMRQKNNSPEDILNNLKPYMSSSDMESFDQMMSMMSMAQEMQNMSDPDFDPMSMMAGMFTQDTNTEMQKEGEQFDGLDKRPGDSEHGPAQG